ncbi:MAG: filamentous hemagglutinin N-terminal domain-containing protein, partial [Noviherbaspirillum sp.]
MQDIKWIMNHSAIGIRQRSSMAWPLGALLAGAMGSVQALPQGGQTVQGAASISQSGAAMTVEQSSQRAAINWQSFGIGAAESVNFVQPSPTAIMLNRVLGQDPSRILGSLSANGQIFLTNPNGILFGQGAQVNVGGLIASTHGLSDADFQSGQYRFTRAGNPASVVNRGSLTAANGGYIALLGPQVRNQGVISTPLGTALLGAGDQVTVYLNNGSLVGYNIDKGALAALAENASDGQISAFGGSIFLSARAADRLASAAVNNQGNLSALSIENRDGVIRLVGDMEAGEVNQAGRLSVTGNLSNGTGGTIETSAARVNIASTAEITAGGRNDQGNWLIQSSDFRIADSGGNISPDRLSQGLDFANITVQTTKGSIALDSRILWSSSSSLALESQQGIDINAGIVAEGNLRLRADRSGSGLGTVSFGSIGTNSGSINSFGGGRTDIYYNPAAYSAPSDASYAQRVFGPFTAWMLVNNVEQLQAMNTNLAGNYALGRDIEAGSTRNWNNGAGFAPIGGDSAVSPFNGQFDGLKHTINGLFINRPAESKVGLFGLTTNRIANVGLTAVNMTGGTVTDSSFGALAATNTGHIENAFSSGAVHGGTGGAGGLVGMNSGTLDGVYSEAYAYGYVAGGLVGSNSGTISNAYSTGNVNGLLAAGGLTGVNTGNISTAYSRSKVSSSTGARQVGGLVGSAGVGGGGSVVNAYWDRQLSSQETSVGGGTRLESAQMLDPASFSGFDPTIWRQYEGHTAPLLKSFLKPLTIAIFDQGKVYDGQGWTGLSNVRYGDADAAPANVFATPTSTGKNAGTYTSAPQFWSNQQGYDLSFSAGKQTAQQTIDPALLKLDAVPDSKTYDATAASSGAVSVTGLVAGDSVSVDQVFDAANAGARKLRVDNPVIADGNGGANYRIVTTEADGTITPKALSISAAADNKVYDGTAASAAAPIVDG